MPVSGNEEPGVVARQSSSCSAGVPIKKRRLPLVWGPSPLPQELLSGTAENDSLQKEQSNISQESSLSNASIVTNSPSFSDVNKNSFSEEKKEGLADTNVNSVQNNVNLSRVKLEEANTTISSGSIEGMDSKEKLVLTENSSCQKITGNTELHLAPNEASTLTDQKEILSKQKVEGDCKLELSNLPSNTVLSLGLKEPLSTDFEGQNSGGSCQVPEKLDPSTLCLSLGKETPISQCGSDDVNSNHGGANLHANRSNWDLNTTMDAWEGSIGNASAGQGTVVFDGLSQTSGALDMKPSICSTGMLGVGVDSGKQILGRGENKSNFPISSLAPSQIYKSDDSLHLRLSMSPFLENFRGEHSGSSAEVSSGRFVLDSNLLGALVSSGKLNSVGCRTVKLEPLDGNGKHDFVGAKGSPMGLLDSTAKRESLENYSFQAVKFSTSSPQKLVENRTIKSEPVQEGNQETHQTSEGTLPQSDRNIVQCHDNRSSTIPMPLNPQKLYPSALSDCSTELSISRDTPNQSEHSIYAVKEVNINMDTAEEACASFDQVASETMSLSVGFEGKSNVSDGRIDASREEDLNVDDPETGRLKLMDELPLNSNGDGEGSVSDEEKINISADMLEEEAFGSDYESDGNHALVVPMDTEDRQYDGEDDEYEDGEVREPLVNAAVEDPIDEKRGAENFNLGDCENKNVVPFGLPGDGITQSRVNQNENKSEDHGETSDGHIKACVDKGCVEIADTVVDKDVSLLESLTVEVVTGEADEKSHIEASHRKPLDRSGKKEVRNGHETEVSFDGAYDESQGTVAAVGQAAEGNIKGTDRGDVNSSSTLSKTEASLNVDDATKNANSGGNRSRIITLPRASNVTSPSKTRPIPGRSFPSRTGRERYIDFEGDKLYPRGNRDEIYVDGPQKFIRERIQDQSFRNSRPNFVRGRGRVSRDTLRGHWETDRDFAPELYNGAADYQFPRHKRAPAVADTELECDGYIIAPRGAIVGTGRGGRKPLSDELCSFGHPSARRRSPQGRDGPATRGIQMVHRVPRNISPSRCTGEVDSDLIGLRPGEKFMRGLPDDVIDPVFTRSHPPFEGGDGQFVRGNRNFSSVQRRGLPRIRSKSPIRYRTRSPGTWTSPRRRSPDGFNGLSELTHHRSSAMYRMERMRSPDHPCFPEEMVARRHGSPYMSRPSNDLRDMDSGRDHDHPRAIIPNRRSPSNRVLPRSTRRFDILDPRERDHDDYFGGPMHPGRFHELGGDGSGDERRKFGERRGPVRSFRPPYNGADNGSFRFHVEDGPRPFRFCPEADSEFLERSSLREREFDRRIKNRHVNAPRRTRNIEEQEANYRHGGQGWHDDGLDDVSHVKRRRF